MTWYIKMDEEKYNLYQKERFEFYENACRRCGVCCGAEDGDPCANLVENKDGKYFCRVYKNRLGAQKTASGKAFHCTPIKEIITHFGARPNCAYAKSPSPALRASPSPVGRGKDEGLSSAKQKNYIMADENILL